MTPKCPSCRSTNLRRSRHRPEDGVWRSLFYTAYRCRDCGRRFQQLTSGLLLGAAIASLGALTFGAGFVLGGFGNLAPPRAEPAAGAPSAITLKDGEADGTPAPVTIDLALAAAAEDGDPKAQLRLGMAYLNPQGGAEPDPALALKWIQRAADQGYADAQYALGAVHHAGRGALQSFPVAVKWFELAAQQNHADAQYSLGVMYRTGQGVPVDKSKAYIWFNLSAAQGHPRAREARDSLLTSLSPEQVLAAQRTAQEWRPGKPVK
jgi:hypothetical protein